MPQQMKSTILETVICHLKNDKFGDSILPYMTVMTSKVGACQTRAYTSLGENPCHVKTFTNQLSVYFLRNTWLKVNKI